MYSLIKEWLLNKNLHLNKILMNHQLHSSSITGDTLISKRKLRSWFHAFRSQRCQPLPFPFMTALMGIVEELLDLDQVKALFLLCYLDSTWTSPGYAEICCELSHGTIACDTTRSSLLEEWFQLQICLVDGGILACWLVCSQPWLKSTADVGNCRKESARVILLQV